MKRKAQQEHHSLAEARRQDRVDTFIKEHETDPEGDIDKLDALIKRPTRGSGKEVPKASSQDASGD